MKICICRLPHAGLGNKLFVWAQGLVYSYKNNSHMVCYGWYHLHYRTLLKIILGIESRHEYYLPIFKNTYPVFARGLALFTKPPVLKQPECDKASEERIVLFDEMYKVNERDLFYKLKDYRDVIINNFFLQLKGKFSDYKYEVPEIAIHVRRGDFVLHNFATPSDYYIQIIQKIRNFLNNEVPVTIYTDAKDNDIEISKILKLPKVKLAKPKHALLDIIEMSKSKILIMSYKSTFSQWAGFLSDNIVINHPGYIGEPIRDNKTNLLVFEGVLPEDVKLWPELLKNNLLKLFKK